MLTPVQRTPRYRMLLKKYLEKLPKNSTQRDEVLSALEFVSFAADHSNNFIELKVSGFEAVKDRLFLVMQDFSFT